MISCLELFAQTAFTIKIIQHDWIIYSQKKEEEKILQERDPPLFKFHIQLMKKAFPP